MPDHGDTGCSKKHTLVLSLFLHGTWQKCQCCAGDSRRAMNSDVPRSFANAGSSFTQSMNWLGSLLLGFARRKASNAPLRSPLNALDTAKLLSAHVESGSASHANSRILASGSLLSRRRPGQARTPSATQWKNSLRTLLL